MPWLGIWFEHAARDSWARSPEWFEALAKPVVYPFVHSFIEAESARLERGHDPSTVLRDGQRYGVYYSLAHDGGQGGPEEQGCRIFNWLFQNFARSDEGSLSARFSEIPVVIHDTDPVKAAAMANALTLLRFLGAGEDQAVARIMVHPWDPGRGGPRLAALDYERRVLEFLRGEIFYPEGVTIFDVLGRRDLRQHRSLAPCCETQIGFVRPLLEWIDECWPDTDEAASELASSIRNSLVDEARYLRARTRRSDGAGWSRDAGPQPRDRSGPVLK